MKSTAIKTMMGVALITISAAASAVPIDFSVDGVITSADAGNAFGLVNGDIVTASGVFDSDSVDDTDPSFAFVDFGLGTGNRMEVSLGAITLYESNDELYLDGFFPVLVLSFGDFLGIDFIASIGTNGSPVDFGSFNTFFATDVGGLDIEGEWIASSFRAISVPEPSTLSILGISLGLLPLMRRRSPAQA